MFLNMVCGKRYLKTLFYKNCTFILQNEFWSCFFYFNITEKLICKDFNGWIFVIVLMLLAQICLELYFGCILAFLKHIKYTDCYFLSSCSSSSESILIPRRCFYIFKAFLMFFLLIMQAFQLCFLKSYTVNLTATKRHSLNVLRLQFCKFCLLKSEFSC